MKTPEEIAMIIDNAKRIGVQTVTIDDVVYNLLAHQDKQVVNPSIAEDLKPEDIFKNLSTFEMPSDDEVLYWATPYYNILQAEKELRTQQLKDEELKNG